MSVHIECEVIITVNEQILNVYDKVIRSRIQCYLLKSLLMISHDTLFFCRVLQHTTFEI